MLAETKFLFTNRFSDIEFFDESIVREHDSEQLMQLQNFLRGPQVARRAEDILISQSSEADITMVLYEQEADLTPGSPLNMRTFRRYHMINPMGSNHVRYWIVNDPTVAKALGLTRERCCYALRPTLNSVL